MKKTTLYVIVGVIGLSVLLVALYNIKHNENFWDTSATTCISLIIAGGLSFYVVQRQTDRRKQKDIFMQLLGSLKDLTDDEKSYRLVDRSTEEILMQKRAMNNKIAFIKKYSQNFSIERDVLFLEEKHNEYVAVIDGHINDLETLGKLGADLKRPLSLMSQKIFEMMFNLYS